jgi:hypothetical protein
LFVARHTLIADEKTAREHLDQLGLLTTRAVRIASLFADSGWPPGSQLPS